MRAIWNDHVIAESDATIQVEGNHYFPPDSVTWDLLAASPTTSQCGWKGTATYYSVQAGGDELADAAWTYAEPLPAAANITGYLAFWKGVQVK